MKKDRFNMRNGLMIIRRGIFLSIILSSLFACASVRIKQSAVKPDEIMNFVDKNYDNFLITYSSGK